ncbi:hypothetical protein [Parahaliea mediterranea]|uniref:HlyD family efflux transporter periplasmic adaptor subunit n=1 Tax=Parahaliea mediterranea TaxID=651086 RepID=A0A939DEB4_9GAMM|nr:hypothetical protein [Parahaliea mediterranea]MBN7795952.1 hypothetical protein [Parahaliea mediterranea]
MKTPILALALAGFCAAPAQAQRIDIDTLGSLQLDYTRVAASAGYTGAPLAGDVGFRPGDALSVVSPYHIQRIRYLVNPGGAVTRGQPVAELAGPEIHHFLVQYEVAAERLAVARKRFESNRELYQRRAIDEQRWIEISDAYFSLRLEHEHLAHFRELLREAPDNSDHILFTAPAAGRLLYRLTSPGIAAGGEIAQVVPDSALRLRVAIPAGAGGGPSRLARGECDLAIDAIDSVVEGFHRRAWSAPLAPECPWLPGQRVMVSPFYPQQGYEVPRESLLHWEGDPAVLLRSGAQLELVPVEVVSSTTGGYFVRCDATLSDREVLSASVSAVQGILLGLGGE